jgi:uncharacterized protein (TIGR03000 family)
MTRTRLQVGIVLAAGALLGYLAATGNLPLGRLVPAAQAGQAPEVIKITVRMPADAVLAIDDHKTTSTGEVRTFETPPLQARADYAYTLKATSQGKEVVRKIHVAHGADNTFDLRADFAQASADQPPATRVANYGPQTTGAPGSPDATTTIDGRYVPPPPQPFLGRIGLNAMQSKPAWPARVAPPKGAPNVLLILLDDAGYGSNSTFGGVIPTPTLDKIAANGLRYTNFHSTSLCSPTRGALLTGRNHHSVGFGVISEIATGFPGYDSVMGPENATIAKVLGENGYRSGWWGKNHNTPAFETSQAGPFNQWPTGMGFDYFYGFNCGDTSQ